MFGSNSPTALTPISAEVRKSLSFGIWLRDRSGRPLDLSDSSITIVIRRREFQSTDKPSSIPSNDNDNLISNDTAEIVAPLAGYGRFNLQASDLNLAIGEYVYTITLTDNGYSTVLAKGPFLIVSNTEVSGALNNYDPVTPPTALQVVLRNRVAISVTTGPALAPGATSFLISDREKLEGIEAGAQVNVLSDWLDETGPGRILNRPKLGSAAYYDADELTLPPGGSPGEVLMKISSNNFHAAWAQVPGGGGGGGGLDATGVLAGRVPQANGADSWAWTQIDAGVTSVNGQEGAVNLSLSDLPEDLNSVHFTPAMRDHLSSLSESISWNDLLDRPDLGTMAAEERTDYIRKGQGNASDISSGLFHPTRIPRVSELRGFSSGTAAPTGGSNGDIYFQYSA